MKYAHLEEKTDKILGWYDDSIHQEIPTPNIEVSEEVWQEAVNINANCYEDGKFIVKDFRTNEEIVKQEQAIFRANRDSLLKQIDIEINKAEDLGEDTESLRRYRVSLRNATDNWVIPERVL